MLGYVHFRPTVTLRVSSFSESIRVRNQKVVKKGEKGKVGGNFGGGSYRYRRANRSRYLSFGGEILVEPSSSWFLRTYTPDS